ncbi:MAG: FG-GAP repeat protein, partial [Leptospirales bacterium]
WTQEAYVKASNTESTDLFGSTVQISRHILAVGAVNDDSNARVLNGNDADNSSADSGAVYVYLYDSGAWKQTTYIKSANSDAGDGFGTRMGLSGDALVIASASEDSLATGINGDATSNASTNSGAVYMFQ